jgi:chorismate synthase
MLRVLTAGESHGKAFVAILEGMVANLPLTANAINDELARRQQGYGRGARMKIEQDEVEIISGVRHGKTLGSPIALLIKNRDWANWETKMSAEPVNEPVEKTTLLRPGHADYAGLVKYHQDDIRNILERASARETVSRVAVGAVAKGFLSQFGITVESQILHVGGKSADELTQVVDSAKAAGDTVGGVFEIRVSNVPVGLGSHVHYDRKLDAALAAALMSIQAIKGVEVGLGFRGAELPGSQVHDPFIKADDGTIARSSNHAGGIEGGISNGQPILLRAAMKPIPTLMKPLPSVDWATGEPASAHVERSDTCAIEAAAVVGEAVIAFEIAKAFLEKFGGDSVEETKAHYAINF